MKAPFTNSALRQRGEVRLSGISNFSDSNLFAKPLGFAVAYVPAPLVLKDLQIK